MAKGSTNRLRVVRAEKRKSQLDTALAVGISQSTLSLIENGYVEPSDDLRRDLAKALDVTISELFPVPDEAAAS